jgi:hypothetical protein
VQGHAPAVLLLEIHMDKNRQSGVVLEKTYQFLLWLIPAIEKFPRSQKFTLAW